MRILIGMPTISWVPIQMASFLYALLKQSKHEISITHTNRMDISMARNVIMSDFMKSNNDYLLFLDDDNIPEDIFFLEKLLDIDLPVVSWLVPSRTPDGDWVYRLCIFREDIKDTGELINKQYIRIPHNLPFEIDNCWMGCVLIKRGVVELITSQFPKPCEMRMFTYFRNDNEWVRDDMIDYSKIKDWTLRFNRYMSEDLLFFERARNLWVKLYAHPDVRCTHIGEPNIISIDKHILSNKKMFKIN